MNDELIEIDDKELAFGDQNLKITLPSDVDKKTETVTQPQPVVLDNEELFDTDTIVDIEEPEDEKITTKKVVKVEKENDDDIQDDTQQFIPDDTNEFSVFASVLNDNEFFPDLDDERLSSIKSEEDLQKALEDQMNISFSQWQEAYKQNLVNNLIREGYVSKDNVKPELVSSYTKDDIKGNLELAKQVHYEFYKEKGLPDKQINRIISGIEDLEESALELHDENEANKKLKQAAIANKLKEQEIQAAKQRESLAEELKKNTFEYEEFIPGRKLNKKDKQEVFDNIEPVLVKINQNLSKYAPLLSYLDRYGILDGKFDKIIKEGQTQSVSKLQQILADKKRNTNTTSTSYTNTSGKVNIDNSGVKQIYK